MVTQTVDDTMLIRGGGGGGSYSLIPEGLYKIILKGKVSESQFEKEDKNGKPVLDEYGDPVMTTNLWLQFAVDDPEDDYDGTEFRDGFPQEYTSGNKSGRLFASLLGISIEELLVKQNLKLSDLFGCRCNANLIHWRGKAASPLKKRKATPPPPTTEPIAYDPNDPGF
jgi:hypothetical protein